MSFLDFYFLKKNFTDIELAHLDKILLNINNSKISFRNKDYSQKIKAIGEQEVVIEYDEIIYSYNTENKEQMIVCRKNYIKDERSALFLNAYYDDIRKKDLINCGGQKEFDHHFDIPRLHDDQDFPASILSLNVPNPYDGDKDTRMVLFEYERDKKGNIDLNNLTSKCVNLINKKSIKIISDNL